MVKGKKSGKKYLVPLSYHKHASSYTCVTLRSNIWWKNLKNLSIGNIWLKGKLVDVDMSLEFTDDNLDGNYDDLSDEELYDSENELWHWKVADNYDLSQVCKNCTELRVKGEPAIDNLKYIYKFNN